MYKFGESSKIIFYYAWDKLQIVKFYSKRSKNPQNMV